MKRLTYAKTSKIPRASMEAAQIRILRLGIDGAIAEIEADPDGDRDELTILQALRRDPDPQPRRKKRRVA